MTGINLELFSPLVAGNASLGDFTQLLAPTWRRSIRHIGGFWIGTAEVDTKQIDRYWLDDLFTYGILTEIRETGSGLETWRGFIAKMDYTRGGEQYTMDMANVSNAVRSIYTRVFDNLVTNGDCESGAWTGWQSPTTVVQYAGWKTGGNYSMRIVSSTNNANVNGATIDTVTIAAGVTYDIKVNLRVISGSWRFSVNRVDTDESLAHYSTHGIYGDHSVSINIPNSNEYAGDVEIRISSEGTAAVEIFADDVQLAEQSQSANTGWSRDAASIAALSRKENILLEGGLSDAAANAHVLSEVRKNAWPQVASPPQYQTLLEAVDGVDKLLITFAGYWATLNWTYTRITSSAAVSTHIVNMLARLASDQTADGLSDTFIYPGNIETNQLSYSIDLNTPLRYGDVLREMANAGEADGSARWGLGVYEGRYLNYERIAPEATYLMRGGQVYDSSGAEVDPWLARPGWCVREDMPLGPHASEYVQHDPRWEFFEEVEMLPDGKLIFNREAR
jgi:hypothetical protein